MTDDLVPLVKATYLALADFLEALPQQEWDSPSLCEHWRVREVVAHLTMPSRYREEAFMAELRADDFDFTRLSNRIAARDAALPTDALVRDVHDPHLHEWAPPGGGTHGALSHVVIHSLDITVPLDAQPVASETALRTVLDDLTTGGGHAHFGTDIQQRKLHAIDIDWSYGTGPLLSGPADELVAHICGRTIPDSRLHGEPLTRHS